MAALSVWMVTTELVFGWLATIFFGSITLILLIRHFKYGRQENEDAKTIGPPFNAQEEKINDELNIEEAFTFNGNSFTYINGVSKRTIGWKQVQSMVAYKMDRFACDDICLDVFCDNHFNFTITEESAAWNRFLDHSKDALPAIDKFWEIAIISPPFETNLTLVYDRQNRSLKEIVKMHYSA